MEEALRLPRTGRHILPRLAMLGTLLLNGLALYQAALPPSQQGILFLSRRWLVSLSPGVALFAVTLVLFLLSLRPGMDWLLEQAARGQAVLRRFGGLNLFVFLLAAAAFGVLVYLPVTGIYFNAPLARFYYFWAISLAGVPLLSAAGVRLRPAELLLGSLVIVLAIFAVAARIPEVSNYPFTLAWSEGSRYYYASLYFAGQVYGVHVPLSVLHPTRYLMQSLPFLLPGSPLWLHRLWQVLLFLATSLATGYFLAKRLDIQPAFRRRAFILWAALFLLLALYYHLLVIAILVLALFDRNRPWRALAVVLLASLWAGVSRVNWFPVPGLLACALYFLETPKCERPLWRYLLFPALWALAGTGVAFAAQAGYAVLSGNPLDQFSSSLSSDLLWYRLLPSATYSLGILWALVLACIPLFWAIAAWLRKGLRLHWSRGLGVAAILLVLFAGGLVVSVKIGGGSNLHNMDAFLTLLLVASSYAFFGRIVPEGEADPINAGKLPWAPAVLALLVVAFFTLPEGYPLVLPPQKDTDRALQTVQEYVGEAVQAGKPVLFISDRQLETFGLLGMRVPLVPDYEKVFLMEMAMAGNQVYLGHFYDQLRLHQFGLIVSEPLYIQEQTSAHSFGEENNAWVQRVSAYVLCYYRPARTLINPTVQLLVPRDKPEDCELP